MSLDISTLVLLTIAICSGLGGLSIVFSHLQAGTRGARVWGMGMIGLGTGYALIFLHPYTQGHALLYAGWVCIVPSVLLMHKALHRICSSDEGQTLFGFAVFGGAVAGWLFFGLVVPSGRAQLDVTSVAISVITGRAAWDLLRFSRRTRYRAPPLAVAGWLLVVSITPLVEILLRGTGSGTLEPTMEYGPPSVVFARVVIIGLLSTSVLWLEISRLYEAIEDQATHDELTGIFNRRAIVMLLQRELARSRRENASCSIATFDVDFFKHVNDTWGHPAGDEVLKWVTRTIGRNIRTYDTLGRYGGEEFLLIMPGIGRAGAMVIADRARLAIEEQVCTVGNAQIRITISAGVAASNGDGDPEALLQLADDALYRAKKSGRNRVAIAEAPDVQSAPAANGATEPNTAA
jgi:diguanylate cyclase (GGDEF)-like protein